RASNGEAVAVTDDEIKDAMKLCARKEAVLAEPASAATLAAVLKLKEAGKVHEDETVVTIITGSALRDLPLFSDPGNEVPFVHPGNDAEMLAAMDHYQQ
ncbi:MAG: pyridoxal-phosphate dependent enzyme, partial [Lachnospiraceae bacterium]|nr:pyridoxal-phosphate dependent enzyme [Lachnospiraceae bacterium]